MPSAGLILLAVFTPFVVAGLGLALPRRWISLRVGLSVLAPAVSVAALVGYARTLGLQAGSVGWQWMPQLRLDLLFHVDRLGLFFALLVAGIGFLITLYGRAYFGKDPDSLYRFYPSLLLFMTAMLGLVLADSFMLLLLFWELTSISSFLLIGWERDDKAAVKKALQAFIVTGAGGLALMAGLILLGVHTGTWTFTELIARGIANDGLTVAAFALIFVGAAAKSAQWPLHFWLPGAMAAPTPVSAYLHSATMVKAGVYLLGRLWPVMSELPAWPMLLIWIGAFTMVLGAYVGLRKSDLKQIFAYTTVSQLGLFVCMYGLAAYRYHGEPNLLWDVTQIANHALYKAPLFMIAGAVAHVVHTRELPELRGLFHRGRTEKVLAIILVLAAYAMASGPLTLGFAAKEYFFYGIAHAQAVSGHPAFWLLVAAGIATGLLQVAIFLRLTRVVLGSAQQPTAEAPHPPGHDVHGQHDYEAPLSHDAHVAHPHETGFWPAMLWVPALLLVAMQYVGGIVPGVFEGFIRPVEPNPHYFGHVPSVVYLLTHPGLPLYMSLIGIVAGVGLALSPVFTRTIADVHDRLFPAFYDLATKGGGWVFALVQTGNLRTYLAAIFAAIVGMVAWSTDWQAVRFAPAAMEGFDALLPEYLMAIVVCAGAILMPMVKERASRIMVLGLVGFAVTAVYYLYQAPDLALTQISIEIVSLILFLLVLGLLPRTEPTQTKRKALRLTLAVLVGASMFWLVYSSATADRAPMPWRTSEGKPFAHLGEFFLRNSHYTQDIPAEQHKGGGGDNVVNVILVDFRGFDTLGEITVLGLAALGVWTLLRRNRRRQGTRALHLNIADADVAGPAADPAGQEAGGVPAVEVRP